MRYQIHARRKLLALSALTVFAAATSHAAAESSIADPEKLDAEGFREVLVQVGDVYISGQPTPAGLERLQALGVTTVVNLRTAREMDSREIVPFDEAEILATLGMTYVHIPAGGPATPYAPAMVEQFATALAAADGKVLLHCTVAWRASHLWTAYLTQYKDVALADAVAHSRQINLGELPLEGFLGERLLIQTAQ
ncbi:MAG: sulfur transferase domain-containing protein [Gammaproteobacteria bacterium]|nr:sulfur transferase domain-containing protein [Gammaproteobacteria bacterium]